MLLRLQDPLLNTVGEAGPVRCPFQLPLVPLYVVDRRTSSPDACQRFCQMPHFYYSLTGGSLALTLDCLGADLEEVLDFP